MFSQQYLATPLNTSIQSATAAETFQTTTALAEILVDSMSVVDLLAAHQICAYLGGRIAMKLAEKAQVFGTTQSQADERRTPSSGTQTKPSQRSQATQLTKLIRTPSPQCNTRDSPSVRRSSNSKGQDPMNRETTANDDGSEIFQAQMTHPMEVRCKQESPERTDEYNATSDIANAGGERSPSTKSFQVDTWAVECTQNGALDLTMPRVTAGNSSTNASCGGMNISSLRPKLPRIEPRPSIHGVQHDASEPHVATLLVNGESNRRLGIRKHRRVHLWESNSHPATARTIPVAEFPLNSSKPTQCKQKCSTCQMEFSEAVAFVRHIQQVHIGLNVDQISHRGASFNRNWPAPTTVNHAYDSTFDFHEEPLNTAEHGWPMSCTASTSASPSSCGISLGY
ncbi:unnamed protein product [Dicrocoelium dendriticum]|nr:unnamed protein product [Dicrocoelium dendriticum]